MRVRILVWKSRCAVKARWIGIAAVLAIAVGIAAYKSSNRRDMAKADSAQVGAAAAPAPGGSSVVLVADLGEANDPCVCGKIIRSVRSAGAKGVPVKEVDPEKSPELASTYKALVSPVVIILDGNGKEVRRFEGESNDTFASIQSALDHLPSKTP